MNIARIAEVAGVSKMTVSRVINSAPGVGDKTRARIQTLLDDLDFVPNSTARALATGGVRSIGFVSLTSEISRTVAETLVSLQRAANAAGWRVTIVGLDVVSESTVRDARQQLRQDGAEVVVVTSPQNASRPALQQLADEFPAVGIWTPSGSIDSVAAPDSESGASVATRHLLDLGHATVAHVSGPDGWMATEHRELGWRSELGKAGAEIIPAVRSDWTPGTAFEAAHELLVRRPDITAVFAANDTLALGVMRAAQLLGLDIPEDLSIVGYDNIPESGYFSPPLTTIAQQYGELGLLAFNEAMRRIGELDTIDEISLTPPTLILRETTAPPKR